MEAVALTCTGMALGIDPHARFQQVVIQLQAGDFVLGYTDGVTEACNDQQELFGESRLRAEISKHCPQKPAKILEAILRSVRGWSASSEYIDDITWVMAGQL